MKSLSSRLIPAACCWTLLLLLAGPAAGAAVEKNASRRAAMSSIVAGRLRAHVEVLAGDAMQGREAGTAGGQAAAEYLVQRLEELGLKGAAADGGFYQPFADGYRNVLARLEGRDPQLARQTVVLGAHYDHIGLGSKKTSLGSVGQVHNGADDNGSGTAAILALAEAFSLLAEPPRRSVLFAFWDAEEKGLLGSKHWMANATAAPQGIVAAVNVDMVGRLRDDRLILFGSRTAEGYRRLVAANNAEPDLRIDFSPTLVGNADHFPFVEHDIPILFAHTDVQPQSHRETDDVERINSEGMTRIVRLLFGVACDLADSPRPPAFRTACRSESTPKPEPDGALPHRFGVAWKPQPSRGGGVELTSVDPGSAAANAGIRPGDRVVELAGHTIHSGDDLAGAVLSAVNPVRVLVKPRESDQPRELVVQLDGQPLRLGVTWELDAAEPGTVVVKQVFPGSAAGRAGLRPGDRIYQVAGRDFANDTQFAAWITTLPGPLELLVEREGRLITLVVRFADEPLRRAA
ncbi:MAG: M28 family peptidase [Thermoguttaceae bacterium]